jgi:hypothetical protein
MPDYNNSKIYTIRCKVDNSLIYVGSTTQPLSKRMVEHRSKHNKEKYDSYTKPLYIKMREFGIENFYIELYEDYPCERKEQLEKKEGEITREIGNLNKVVAGIQWRTNKKENDKNYYDENKIEILEKNKIYRQENKTFVNQLSKKYYEDNKLKISEQAKKEHVCLCGCKVRSDGIRQHLKTQKHLSLINNQDIIKISS